MIIVFETICKAENALFIFYGQIKVSFRQACLTCGLFTISLANARGSDTRQANKSEPRATESEPRATESEPRALASGIVNNS